MSSDSQKLWGGRFTQRTDQNVETFSSSVSFDRKLYRHDIAGSIAHAHMLSEVGILRDSEFDAIRTGLQKILEQIESGDFEWSDELEDVHMNIEMRLTEDIGEAGKKLHTARSRNDQVATDLRLYTRESIDRIVEELNAFQKSLMNLAEVEADTIIAGLYPSASGATGHARSPPDGMVRNARPGPIALYRRAGESKPIALGRGRTGRNKLSDRPGDDRERTGLRRGNAQFA